MKDFPLDYESIPKGGLQAWHEEFSLPRSAGDIFNMGNAIRESFFECIRNRQGTYAGDLLLAEIKTYLDFNPVICGFHMVELLKDSGLNPIYSPRSGLAIFSEGRLPGGRTESSPPPLTMKRRLRNIAYNIRVNKDPLCHFKSSDRHGVVFNIQPAKESDAYVKERGISYRYADKAEWLRGWGSSSIPTEHEASVKDAAMDAADAMLAAAAKFGFNAPEKLRAAIREMTLSRLTASSITYEALKRNVAAFGKPIHLLAGNLAPSYSRLFALCVNRAGGMSVAFIHGHDPVRSSRLRFETSLASRIVTYTDASAQEYRNTLLSTKFRPVTSNEPEFISANTNMYRKIWDASRASSPKSIETVVVPGFPYDSLYNMMWGLPELALLDLELRTVSCLREAGFKVIYKIHPDGVMKEDSLPDGTPIRRDRFETMMMEADAFAFCYHTTSVFPLALASDRSMALIHTCDNMDDYEPDAFRMLKQRCLTLIPKCDSRNRLLFDKDSLISHLSSPASTPDMELLNKYFDIPGRPA